MSRYLEAIFLSIVYNSVLFEEICGTNRKRGRGKLGCSLNLKHQLIDIGQSNRLHRSSPSLLIRNPLLFYNPSRSVSPLITRNPTPIREKKKRKLTKENPHVFRLRLVVLALHRLEIQRRLIQTGVEIGREGRVEGLGGGEASFARAGGGRDGDGGGVVEMGGDGGPDGGVEGVVVAEEEVVAAEAAVVFAGDLEGGVSYGALFFFFFFASVWIGGGME